MKRFLLLALTGALVLTMMTGCATEDSSSSLPDPDSSPNSTTVPDPESEGETIMQAETQVNLVQFQEPQPGDYIVTIQTESGEIKAQLFPQIAPKAVENFVTHAQNGYYDGLTFHRILKDLCIQGGDPKGNGTGGESIWGGKFEDEFSWDLYHFTGALCYANSGANSNGSQFFIVDGYKTLEEDLLSQMREIGFNEDVVAKYAEVGGNPGWDLSPYRPTSVIDYGANVNDYRAYVVFGQVTSGMEIVDQIAGGAVIDQNGTAKAPVIITKVTVEQVQ